MEEAEVSRYWCHMCSQTVNPIMEIETIKCPICQSGFVEEMASAATLETDGPLDFGLGGSDSDRALSLWAPILLGIMDNPRRRHRIRSMVFENDDDDNDNENNHRHNDGELDSIIRTRTRRSSAAILQLIQRIRSGMLSEVGNSENDNWDRERDNYRDIERVILINPFKQTIIVRGSYDPSNESHNRAPTGSLGDYFIGPGLDLLLQYFADNDPNRYGTPPAQKEAVEALPTVKIEETMQCSVCLDDCEMGSEVQEMPCKHKFHSGCILPWLELHSSCPVCRYQLPSEESKVDSEGSRNNSNSSNQESIYNAGNGGDERNENGRRFSVPLLWPFSSLFSSSSSESSSGNSSATSPLGSSTNAPSTTSHADQN